MCNKRNGEPELPGVVTKFLEPRELVETAKGWVTAKDWLENLQKTNFRGIRTAIVKAAHSERIALRRLDGVAA